MHNMNIFTRTAFATALLLVVSSASAKDLVREFSGSASTVTPKFTVESPWILDWHLFADYKNFVALDVQLLDADTGLVIGRVLHTKRNGNGVKLFSEGGSYRLRISATFARWGIKIEQLTDEEAELYTPRR